MHPNGNESTAILSELGRFVWERRRANGMTQSDLALLAGVGRRFVSDLERGKTTLRLATANAVLAVFGKRLGLVDAERPASVHEESAARGPGRERGRHG